MTISTWKPLRRNVSAITNANPAVVTTSVAHGYLAGTIVRFFFPVSFGMGQLSKETFDATILSSTQFSIPVNTISFDPFVITSTTQTPQVFPVGETALTLANRERNTLTPVGGSSP